MRLAQDIISILGKGGGIDMGKIVFPEWIAKLPEAEVPFPGVRIHILQGVRHQVAFTDMDITGEAHEHSHQAQWGIVVEGEMELTIDGVTRIYRKGDTYDIPEGAPHSGRFHTHVHTIDFFSQPDRYQLKHK